MTYGIYCFNNSGELTLSSDALTLGYLGKATLVAVHNYTGDSIDATAGYATWQFSSTGPIIVAVGLKSSGQQGIVLQSIYRHDSSTWYIDLYDMTTTTEGPNVNAQFFIPSSSSDIYVFGLPSSLPPYGVAMYDSSGNLSADMSRAPLRIAARPSLADSVLSTTVPSMTKPAILGDPNSNHTLSSGGHGGVNPWINTRYKGGWQLSGTTLFRNDYIHEYARDDGGIPVITNHGPTTAVLIEMNGIA